MATSILGQSVTKGVKMEIVSQLPETGKKNQIYFVPNSSSVENDVYDEYIWVDNQWEFLGNKRITIVIDSELSETSENPVQNKVIFTALQDKADKNEVTIEIKDAVDPIYQVLYNQHASVTLTSNVSGNIIERGVSKSITLNWNYIFNGTSSTPESLQLKSESNILVDSPDTKTYTTNISETTQYQAISVNKGVTKSASLTISAYYPMYFGSSTKTSLTEDDITEFSKQAIKSSPNGSYNIEVGEGEYVWLCVPSGMVIHNVTSSGFAVPIESATQVEVTDKGTYNCYRSSSTFVEGTFSCVIS